MRRLLARLRAFRDGRRQDEAASEAFTRDLFTGRLARPAVAFVLVATGVAVAWAWNGVSPAIAASVAIAIVVGIVAVTSVLDRRRWRGQDVLLWQQAGRTRRWIDETGGPSPNEHPAQAETWLGTHPRGTVPQAYRVMAASLAADPVVRDRELAAYVPRSEADAAWRTWLAVAPLALAGGDADLSRVRAAAGALPDGDDRRQLEAGVAVADALGRHRRRDPTWLEPLLAAYTTVTRERLPLRQRLRLWFGRLAIVLSFVVPAAGLAVSGLGTPEPFPRAYLDTTIATRGDIGTIDQAALLAALSRLAVEVRRQDSTAATVIGQEQLDGLIADGLPTLIWDVDEIDIAGPAGVGCDRVSSIETLLGDGPPGGSAIVACHGQRGARVMPVSADTIAAIRDALGVDR